MSTTPAHLSIADQRQIVYSSLLKFSPETASLRDRALDRVVLGALLGSTIEKTLQQGEVQRNLHFLKNGPSIRDAVVHETLDRLIRDGKVEKSEHKKRRVFWLTKKGSDEVSHTVAMAGSLFDDAFKEILQNTGQYFSAEQGAMFCRSIILECFARIGRDLAKSVIDSSSNEIHFTQSRIYDVVLAALAKSSLAQDAKDSLCSRIYAFFCSRSSAATRLKFHLTQGFYFTELLGFDSGGFNPLSEHSFQGSVFYLDTNVLLHAIFEHGGDHNAFGEVVRLANKVGITLVATRATLDEIRNTAIEHIGQIRQFYGRLPERLTDKTKDSFFLSYQWHVEQNPNFTLDDFLNRFLSLDTLLRDQCKIEIDERNVDEILGTQTHAGVEQAINAESDAAHYDRKSPAILRHDVCHFALIEAARAKNRKTWFLTQDRILIKAAKRLEDKEWPVCFPLVGFLHSISPFLTTTAEEQPFSELLGEILDLQITKDGVLYEASELALIAEMHSDVLATPDDQLVMALDYVKTKELDGQPYSITDYGRVSLGLKKFLGCKKDEQLRAFGQERTRLELAQQEALRKQDEALKAVQSSSVEITGMRNVITATEREKAELAAKLSAVTARSVDRRSVLNAGIAGAFGVAALVAAIFRSAILDSLIGGFSKDWLSRTATVYDLVFLAVVLWSASVQIELFVSTPRARRVADYGAAIIAVGLFIFVGGHDAGRLNEAIDVAVKAIGAVYFLRLSGKRAQSSQQLG